MSVLIRTELLKNQEAAARTEIARRCRDVAWVAGSVLRARTFAGAQKAVTVLHSLGAEVELDFIAKAELPETD